MEIEHNNPAKTATIRLSNIIRDFSLSINIYWHSLKKIDKYLSYNKQDRENVVNIKIIGQQSIYIYLDYIFDGTLLYI